MIQLNRMQRGILVEGLRDYQSMGELAADARDSLGSKADDDIVRRTVLGWMRPLVESGYAEIGQLTLVGEFSDLTPWPLKGRAAMEELERRWIRLGRDPKIGELAWLQLTSAGEELAHQMEGSA